MKLYECLSEKTALLDIRSRKKGEVIAEVARLLQGHPSVSDFQGFLDAVLARERAGTTGIGNGVAIPHARTDSVRGMVAAVGICRRGVGYEAVDGKPVRLVIVMGIPTSKVKAYLRMLAHLSLLLKQPDFLERVVSASSARDIIDVMTEYEAHV